MTDTPTPLDTMLSIYGRNAGHGQYGPTQFDLNTDAANIDWNRLAQTYQLSPDEVTQLQLPVPSGGPSLQQRLQALRPQVQVGGLNLSTDGHRIQGRMRF